MIWFALASAVLVGVLVLAAAVAGRPSIAGDTPAERIKSICRLADQGRRGAGDVIARAAENDPSPEVRRAALLALQRFPQPRFRQVVETAARGETVEIRSAAVITLGAYGDAPAVDRLGELAMTDPQAEVRVAAVEGLERCAIDRAIVHLVEVMEKSDNPRVQQHARSAVLRRLIWPPRNTRPQDRSMWLNDRELVKAQPVVIEAYKRAGKELKHYPEYILEEPGE